MNRRTSPRLKRTVLTKRASGKKTTKKKPYAGLWTVASYRESPAGRPFAAGATVWCATKGNVEPDERAIKDPTACGYWVVMRTGSRVGRPPTCPECLAAIAKAGAR